MHLLFKQRGAGHDRALILNVKKISSFNFMELCQDNRHNIKKENSLYKKAD